jgi:hypothetical protein
MFKDKEFFSEGGRVGGWAGVGYCLIRGDGKGEKED